MLGSAEDRKAGDLNRISPRKYVSKTRGATRQAVANAWTVDCRVCGRPAKGRVHDKAVSKWTIQSIAPYSRSKYAALREEVPLITRERLFTSSQKNLARITTWSGVSRARPSKKGQYLVLLKLFGFQGGVIIVGVYVGCWIWQTAKYAKASLKRPSRPKP